MADDLRMGLEMELHGIVLTFMKRGTTEFWPNSPSETLVGENAILIPENDATFVVDGKTNWESDWGFRAVGDRFAMGTACGQNAGTCVLELATAANTYGDHAYWTSSRLCAKEFVEVINNFKLPGRPRAIPDGQAQWYPLFDFVDLYNQRVDLLKPRNGFDKSKFKLKPSMDVVGLASGTFKGQVGQKWDAIISTNHPMVKPSSPPFCDIQINYQIDLEWLDQNTDTWIGLWNSMWATKIITGGDTLDPNVGLTQTTSLTEVYRTQIFAALWRAAKAKATTLTAAVPPAALPAIRGLITYLVAAGSVSVEEAGGSTSKNSFPQLPKTSPASVAKLIGELRPEAVAVLKQLAGGATLSSVKTDIASLRVLSNLVAPPGQLSNLSPQIGAATYPQSNDKMLTGSLNPHFDNMWPASLEPPTALTNANLYGFTSAAPFYCAWAGGVKTAYPATRRGTTTGIKMLFEGRYGTDKLNIGFNPYAKDFMFNRSYLSIVRALAPQASVAPAVTAIQQMFPGDPTVQQNFPPGCGPH